MTDNEAKSVYAHLLKMPKHLMIASLETSINSYKKNPSDPDKIKAIEMWCMIILESTVDRTQFESIHSKFKDFLKKENGNIPKQ